MRDRGHTMGNRCRVWIVRYEGTPPADWHDTPAGAVAIEPAEERTMTARRASRYVEAFNRAVCHGTRKIWAVALPVAIRYEGDARPGEQLTKNRCGEDLAAR
jgi:hypothetical protein